MPLIASDFTPQQRDFLRQAAHLVNPNLTEDQVLAWVNRRAVDLVAADVRQRITDNLREDYNEQVRDWSTSFESAFPAD